jgi:L-histidine N-alpha-methyltransferase
VTRVDEPRAEPRLIDFHPPRSDIREDVIEGLAKTQKQLPPKYFYDKTGSELFDRITHLPEYYLTRTEAGIMERHLPEMAEMTGPRAAVIEFGSGSGRKIRQLLSYLQEPVAAVTVEISESHLQAAAQRQAEQFPDLEIIAVCADFMRPFNLPAIPGARRKLVFFPGSTIGNLTPPEAGRLLEVMRGACGPDGAILLGVDLVKDHRILEAAYNDREGVTARFNLNLLERINRELGADFDVTQFRHRAVYNAEQRRIEMHLVSQSQQTVHLRDQAITFKSGETILTEYSHKYEVDGFAELAATAGLETSRVWTDDKEYFAVLFLQPVSR